MKKLYCLTVVATQVETHSNLVKFYSTKNMYKRMQSSGIPDDDTEDLRSGLEMFSKLRMDPSKWAYGVVGTGLLSELKNHFPLWHQILDQTRRIGINGFLEQVFENDF